MPQLDIFTFFFQICIFSFCFLIFFFIVLYFIFNLTFLLKLKKKKININTYFSQFFNKILKINTIKKYLIIQ